MSNPSEPVRIEVESVVDAIEESEEEATSIEVELDTEPCEPSSTEDAGRGSSYSLRKRIQIGL